MKSTSELLESGGLPDDELVKEWISKAELAYEVTSDDYDPVAKARAGRIVILGREVLNLRAQLKSREERVQLARKTAGELL